MKNQNKTHLEWYKPHAIIFKLGDIYRQAEIIRQSVCHASMVFWKGEGTYVRICRRGAIKYSPHNRLGVTLMWYIHLVPDAP